MEFQKTIKGIVQFKGIGLHIGKETEIILKPASSNFGIVFVRKESFKKTYIPALSQNVVDTTLSTVLGKNGVTVATVEHLMAALWAVGIDNIEIEVNGPEIPILDGSSYPFVKKIKKVGICELRELRKIFIITRPVLMEEGDKYCAIEPSLSSELTCSIDFTHPLIQKQKLHLSLNPRNFVEKISKARTFGFLKDIEILRQRGLIAGGSLENAVVLDEKTVLNKDGLRFKDEFVRHKMLDSIGDMALFGVRIVGHWKTHKAGHELHYKLLRKMLTQECGYLIGYSLQESLERSSILEPIAQSASL